MKTKLHIIALFAILVGLSSCSNKTVNKIVKVKAYYGPEQDTTSLAFVNFAYVQMSHNQIVEFAKIYQVDSIPVTIGKNETHPDGCYIIPGTHTIEIFQQQNTYKDKKTILNLLGRYLVTFESEAGKTYTIYATTNNQQKTVNVYVIDDNGKQVASTVNYKFMLKEQE